MQLQLSDGTATLMGDLLTTASVGLWDWDMTTNQLTADQVGFDILGLYNTEPRMPFEEWLKRIHPEDLSKVAELPIRLSADGADSYELEYRVRHEDQHWVWIRSNGRIVERDAQDRPLRACGCHQDISHLKILACNLEQQKKCLAITNCILVSMQKLSEMIEQETRSDRMLQKACEILAQAPCFNQCMILTFHRDGPMHSKVYQSGFSDSVSDEMEKHLRSEMIPPCIRGTAESGELNFLQGSDPDCEVCPLQEPGLNQVGFSIGLRHAGRTHGMLITSIPAWFVEHDGDLELIRKIAKDLASAQHNLEEDQHKQRLLSQINMSHNPMLMIANDGTYLSVNDAYAELYGVSASDITGKSIEVFIGEEQYAREIKPCLDQAFTGRISRHEKRFTSLDGSPHWMQLEYTPYSSGRGPVTAVIVQGTDITSTKIQNEQLQRANKSLKDAQTAALNMMEDAILTGKKMEFQNKLFTSFMDSMPANVYFKDAEGRMLSINKHFTTLLGKPAEEFIGKTAVDFLSNEDAQTSCQGDRQVLESGQVLETEEFIFGHWWQTTKVPRFNEAGETEGLYGISWNITARKQAQDALRKNEQHLRIILDSIGDAVIATDRDGLLVNMNPVAEKLTGWSQQDASGLPLNTVFQLINEEMLKPIACPAAQVLQSGKIIGLSNHTLLVSKDGRHIPVANSAAPIISEQGGIVGVVLVLRDQTKERAARQELEKSEARLRRAQSVAKIGDWEIDLAAGAVSMSAEARRIYGLNSQKTTVKTVHAVPLPEYRNLLDSTLDALTRYGKPYDVEFRIRRPSDQTLVDIHSVAEYNADTNVVFGVIQDITARKRVEERLKKLSEEQSLILNNSILGIALVRHRKFEWVNPRLTEMLGRPINEIQNHSTRLLYATEKDYEENGNLAYGMLSENRRFDHLLHLRNSNGTLFWCRLVGKALNPEDPDEGSIWMFEDISERKETEDKLTRLSIAIEQSPESIIITDLEGSIQYVNPAFETTSGYTRAEALGKNPHILKSDEQTKYFYKEMWETISSGNVWEGRLVNRKKDGTFFTEEASISPVKDVNGTIINYVAIKRDISQELVREEEFRQSQKMEAIGLLAGGVAHDFNNILQGILGFSELLMYDMDKDSLEYSNATEIKKSATKAVGLTKQLLAFGRKQPVASSLLNINDIVHDTTALLDILLGEKYEQELHLDDQLPDINADYGQLSQVLMNLAVNARDAMPEGGVLSIKTERVFLGKKDLIMPKSRPGAFVCLSVADTGSGMDEHVTAHLFDPFFTTKELGKGTGLGLSVVYGIMKQNHGWINVSSKKGIGSVFKLYFPLAENATTAGSSDASMPQEDTAVKVLVVDDDPEACSLIVTILEETDFHVTAAASIGEALEQFEKSERNFDLLLTDMRLPDGIGLELANELRASQPQLPVLLCSGYPNEAERWESLSSSNYHFIKKPFTLMGLVKSINETLTKTQTEH
ncbi:PAS domain S-box protein [Pontiellaceae bacterium B1224]|nr:PAS domain S-box protein [Pontiellaceae bacterium B1224]